MESPAPRLQRLERLHRGVQWSVLLLISLLFAGALEMAHLPAALLIGPMLAAIIAGANGATVRVPRFGFWGAQAVVGRFEPLRGPTAVWGSAPGGATAMVLMAGAFGADARLVAFMQYMRVIMVSIAAAFIARLWVDTSGVEGPVHIWFPAIDWVAFGSMIAIAVVGAYLGHLLRLPSPYFLGAVILLALYKLVTRGLV